MQVNACHQRYHCKRLNIHKDVSRCVILYSGDADVIADPSYGATPQMISIRFCWLFSLFFFICWVAWKMLELVPAKEIVVAVVVGF